MKEIHRLNPPVDGLKIEKNKTTHKKKFVNLEIKLDR